MGNKVAFPKVKKSSRYLDVGGLENKLKGTLIVQPLGIATTHISSATTPPFAGAHSPTHELFCAFYVVKQLFNSSAVTIGCSSRALELGTAIEALDALAPTASCYACAKSKCLCKHIETTLFYTDNFKVISQLGRMVW